METIFHEKQEGQLCAQHALNALLQGQYFTAPDLAEIGRNLDDEERRRMAEGGENQAEYQQFLTAPSDNVDDTGYFSVQVIAAALKVWNLDLIPFNSSDSIARQAQENPTAQKAYICNYHDHWFTVRKIGQQWFNLNSLLTGPQLISDLYLGMFLKQLQNEGYSIFIVYGTLPDCNADQVLSKIIVTQSQPPKLLTETKSKRERNESLTEEERRELDRVLQMSMDATDENERRELERVLAMSLQDGVAQASRQSNEAPLTGDQSSPTLEHPASTSMEFQTEEEMLDAALKMSLETS